MKPTESTSVLGSAADKDAIRRHLALLRRVVKHNSTNEVRECASDCPDSAVSISESPGSQSCWPLICLSAAALGLRDEFEALDHVGAGGRRPSSHMGRRKAEDGSPFIHPSNLSCSLAHRLLESISAIFGVKAANHPSTVILCTQSAQCASLETLGGSQSTFWLRFPKMFTAPLERHLT